MVRTIYLDSNYMCHVENADGRTAYEVDFLDNACDTKVEATRYVPQGHSWKRADGIIFAGPMVALAVDSRMIEAAQMEYETAQNQITDLAAYAADLEYQNALNELGMEG